MNKMKTRWMAVEAGCIALEMLLMSCAATETARDEHGVPAAGRSVLILKQSPTDAGAYQPKAAELVKAGIPEKYGMEEWTAVVLTNEMHQHVGIYNMLGAKMGVRARELLNAPTRTVDVTVEMGTTPPMSCMVDGLQAALGSTLGQNLIHVAPTDAPKAAAVFTHKGKKLRLSLKPDAQKWASELIGTAIRDCGNLTPAYFARIEELSYRVWGEADRNAIFVEEWVQN